MFVDSLKLVKFDEAAGVEVDGSPLPCLYVVAFPVLLSELPDGRSVSITCPLVGLEEICGRCEGTLLYVVARTVSDGRSRPSTSSAMEGCSIVSQSR